jgi:hypothetical protein
LATGSNAEPPLRAHQRAERERFAAGARAEIDDHLAAPRRDEERDELAAFVLHLDTAVDEPRVLREHRAAGDAQAPGRVRRRHDREAVGLQRRERVVARRLHRVDAQVQRRAFARALRERGAPFCAHRLAEPVPQPVGQVGADRVRQRFLHAALERCKPSRSSLVSAASTSRTDLPSCERAWRARAGAVRSSRRGPRASGGGAEREHAFGDERAVLTPICGRAEELAQTRIGRRIERRDRADRVGERLDASRRQSRAHAAGATQRDSPRRRGSPRARPRSCRAVCWSRAS